MKTATNMDQRRNTVSCVSLLSLLVVIIKKRLNCCKWRLGCSSGIRVNCRQKEKKKTTNKDDIKLGEGRKAEIAKQTVLY